MKETARWLQQRCFKAWVSSLDKITLKTNPFLKTCCKLSIILCENCLKFSIKYAFKNDIFMKNFKIPLIYFLHIANDKKCHAEP